MAESFSLVGIVIVIVSNSTLKRWPPLGCLVSKIFMTLITLFRLFITSIGDRLLKFVLFLHQEK